MFNFLSLRAVFKLASFILWILNQVQDDRGGAVQDDGGGAVQDDGGGAVQDDGGDVIPDPIRNP